jgi:hypothetical protein
MELWQEWGEISTTDKVVKKETDEEGDEEGGGEKE